MSKSRSKKFEYRGSTYIGVPKKGIVTVRIGRTARGQNLLVGVYNIAEKSWHNEDSGGTLPEQIKREVEKYFI